MGGACGWFPMSRDEIRAWVEAHQDALPTTLAELSTFPVPFRKVIVGFIPHDTRLALWREHLTGIAREDQELTPEQRAFVQEAAVLVPSLMAAPAPNPIIVAWEARMGGLFSRPQASRIFGTLGPPEPPGGLPLPADARPQGAA
jgi:hypothetical protein